MVPALLAEPLFPGGGILPSRGKSPTIRYDRACASLRSPFWCLRALRAVGRLAQLLGAVTGHPESERDNSSLIKLNPLAPTDSYFPANNKIPQFPPPLIETTNRCPWRELQDD